MIELHPGGQLDSSLIQQSQFARSHASSSSSRVRMRPRERTSADACGEASVRASEAAIAMGSMRKWHQTPSIPPVHDYDNPLSVWENFPLYYIYRHLADAPERLVYIV